MRCGLHRIDGDANITVGAVLETNRAGKSGGELAMDLTLGSPRPDCGPRHEIRYVLRGRHIEEFGACGKAKIVHRRQDVAREAKALVYVEAAVEVGIVDQPFPADSGARLFEVDAHHDLKVLGKPLA